MLRIAALTFALMLTALPASAQNAAPKDAAPDSEAGRYSLTKVDDGYLRLDQRTGQVSLCSRRNAGWACYPMPDERSALEEEIARLQKDNATLKREMVARGIALPGMKQPPKADPSGDQTLKVPSEAELDRAMAVMERIWRRLVEMVQRVQKELSPPI